MHLGNDELALLGVFLCGTHASCSFSIRKTKECISKLAISRAQVLGAIARIHVIATPAAAAAAAAHTAATAAPTAGSVSAFPSSTIYTTYTTNTTKSSSAEELSQHSYDVEVPAGTEELVSMLRTHQLLQALAARRYRVSYRVSQ